MFKQSYRSISTMAETKYREIITINCGGAGINLGQNILKQFAGEQGIGANGGKECKTNHDDSIPISFEKTSNGKFISRSIFCDLDPYSMNRMKRQYSHKDLLHLLQDITQKVKK